MTKVISLSDDAYEYLKMLKTDKESFSTIVKRLIPKNDNARIMEFAGALKDTDFERALNDSVKSRKNLKFRTADFGK